MKKFVSLVLTVCVLLMAVAGAVAEEQTVRVILQDSSAPMMAPVQCADGEAYAVVYDKDGNEVAHVTDAAQIQLVDMTGAEHAAALQNDALSQHSMVTEMFSVVLPEDVIVPEGGYVEMAFTVADTHPVPGAVKAGADVQDADITAQAGKTVTVQLPALDTVTFVVDFGVGQQAEKIYDGVVIPSEGDTTSTMFTPSVSGKAAPSVIASVDGNGDVVVATVKTVNSDEVVPVPDDNTMVITPVAERDYVLDARIHGGLDWAYETISVAKSLNDLPAAETLGAQIDAALQAAGSELTHNDMIVRDLFAVTLYGDLGEAVKEVEKYLDVKFDLGIAQGTPVIVLVSSDNVNWSVLANEDVVVNADGTVSIDLPELGNVAFAVPANAQGVVTSPATGE